MQLRFEQVSKSYGNHPAVRELDFAFADGVTTAVVGPSGAGKTTLLQLCNGLVRPDKGTVHTFGKPIDYQHLPELRRQMGYAVQGVGLFPHLNVAANITLVARMAGWPAERVRERERHLMDLVGLPHDFATRYPHELSGGQQQRVGLCRAMMLNPPVLLLDEPFGALDPVTRHEVHGEFLHLQATEPRTVVLVTHDLREAVRLAQRLLVLVDGSIVQHGPCDEVVQQPANEFVRTFFHSQLD